MRFGDGRSLEDRLGDLRVKRSFALIPVAIGGKWVWLETFWRLDEYSRFVAQAGNYCYHWKTIRTSTEPIDVKTEREAKSRNLELRRQEFNDTLRSITARLKESAKK